MLSDILELKKMSKKQLAQLCEALYALLQNHKIEVQVNPAPSAFTFTTPPLTIPDKPLINPGPYVPMGGTTGDPIPDYGRTICSVKSVGELLGKNS